MKLSFDPRYNLPYFRLHEKTTQVQTLRLSDELNVDIAPGGALYGIELLNADESALRGGECNFRFDPKT